MRVYKTLGIMKINFILAFFAATVLSLSGYRLAAQTAEFINIPFAEPATMDGGTKTLNINIWKGVGDDPQPVVLFVHGGQWELGNNDLIKTYVTPQSQTLLSLRESGITVAAATYRFSCEAIFPAQVHDVKAAIRFLKANAQTYGIDPARIMIMGESAGAQMALVAALSNGETAMEGNVGGNLEFDSSVIACVDCFGMADFLTLASDLYSRLDLGCTDAQIYELVEAPTSSRSRLFGLTTEECNLGTVVANPEKFPEQYALVKEGSPIYHVTPDDPPVLILNGQKDSRVASAQSVKLYQALYDAGIEATLLLDGRAPHGALGPESQAVIKSYILRTLLK